MGKRRFWLALGIPIAGLAGISTIASLPSLHPKSIAYAQASSELQLSTHQASSSAPELSNLFPLPESAAVLADEMTSPELRDLIAHEAKIPATQLAIDGPIALDLQRTQQEPTGEKRSNQLLNEGDPYRLTLDTDPHLPGITITAQAPTEDGALALVAATEQAASSYLTRAEVSAGTAPNSRVVASHLDPIVITGGSGGHQVAAFVFFVVYLLWADLVLLWTKLARDIRTLRQLGPDGGTKVPSPPFRSSIKSKNAFGAIGGRIRH
jgi:hypothetical protein